MVAPPGSEVDAVSLEVFRSALTAISDEMGATLTRSSYSPNIKERRDFSCALFDSEGQMLAQAAHIPVHLGAMPDSVASALAKFDDFAHGDVIALNDPYLGGTHLPDITLITPIIVQDELWGFAANRAHHSDVGGMSPGSMPVATELFQEGIIIPPIKLWNENAPNQAALDLLLRNVRTPRERKGDILAQVAANRIAQLRMEALITRFGETSTRAHSNALLDYAEKITRTTLSQIADGTYHFSDFLEDDGITFEPIKIQVSVTCSGSEIRIDFQGTDPQVKGSVNSVASVAKSAAYYVVRCLLPPEAPFNAGTFRPVSIRTPEGTVVNALAPAAVAGGNVETSQRITDVVFGALAQALPDLIPAASQGTMNNVTAGGVDPRTGTAFAYYETMGGGMGARPELDGLSGVHVHMSNTLNTPIEAFEYAYPMRITEYALREHSGGVGFRSGGDGLIREIEFQVPAQVTLLTERRAIQPYGLQGGQPGELGQNVLSSNNEEKILPGKLSFQANPGDRLSIRSPGGGGWGVPSTKTGEAS